MALKLILYTSTIFVLGFMLGMVFILTIINKTGDNEEDIDDDFKKEVERLKNISMPNDNN